MTKSELEAIIAQQNKTIEMLNMNIKSLEQSVSVLNETIKYLNAKLYGTSREKRPVFNEVPGQMELDVFNEAENEADPSVSEPTEKEIVEGYERERKKRSSRESILKDLPVREVICRLGKDDQICPECGTQLSYITKQFVRQEIEIIPAEVKVVKYYKEVWGCPKCKKDAEHDVIVNAETPSPLFKHSLASPTSLAYIMYQKFVNAVPYYRQEQDWKQLGISLSRAVQANWVIKGAMEYMKPIYDLMKAELLKREVLHADETTCQVLKEDGKPATSKSYMWLYLSDEDGKSPVVIYEYRPDRKGENARNFLKGFQGYLHCDGYQGYNSPDDVIRVGCWAHLRRYMFDALPQSKGKNTKKTPAEIGFDYCNRLFEAEKTLQNKSPKERYERRLVLEKPILEAFWSWLDTVRAVGGSRLDKAVTYARNQKPYMENYLLDGRCSLSNNAAERKIKSYVIGRKNFLFHDTVKGAEASSIVYSLIETAKANDLNILKYLKTVLLYMPDYVDEPEGIADMLPWSDFMQKNCKK